MELFKQLAADFPNLPEFRLELARSHNNLGNLLRNTGRPSEEETAFNDALDIYKQLAADFPQVSDYRSELAGALGNLALVFRKRRQFAESQRLLVEAMPHHQAALTSNSRNPAYRQFYLNNLAALVQTCAGLGDPGAALQAAEKLLNLGWDPASDAYNAACTLALGAGAVAENDQLSAEMRQQLAGQFADRAIALLRQAIECGFKDAAQMKQDTDLNLLHDRPDFQKLLSELEQP
jgi:tetratricopeptide (TPR) repeat protein